MCRKVCHRYSDASSGNRRPSRRLGQISRGVGRFEASLRLPASPRGSPWCDLAFSTPNPSRLLAAPTPLRHSSDATPTRLWTPLQRSSNAALTPLQRSSSPLRRTSSDRDARRAVELARRRSVPVRPFRAAYLMGAARTTRRHFAPAPGMRWDGRVYGRNALCRPQRITSPYLTPYGLE